MNKDDGTIDSSGKTAAATNKKRQPKPTAKATSAAAAKPSRPMGKHRLCKALECQKYRQGKTNGYCVACFQKHGTTTCRDFNCINKIHKDGYCISHFVSVVDKTTPSKPSKTAKKKKAATKPSKPAASVADKTAASKQKTSESAKKKTATKPSKLEPSKPAASIVDHTTASKPSASAKKKTATKPAKLEPSKPAKKAKTKHRYRERFTFPATATQKTLRIDANSRNPNQQTITKNDLQSLFDSVLTDTRHAKSTDGNAHYLFDEIREKVSTALETALESSLSSSLKGKKKPVKSEGNEGGDEAEAVTAILGISEEAFTADEVASMPVVFSYHCEDAVSEQNAKIATLDYEVEQGRKKRQAATSSSGQAAKKRKSASPDDRSVSSTATEKEIESEPATEFPSGWTKKNVPRKNGTKSRPCDTYYYSPKLRLKFRSRPEVKRFIALLESCDNDEMKAHSKFKRR